jgi:hypothetical protein
MDGAVNAAALLPVWSAVGFAARTVYPCTLENADASTHIFVGL